MYIKLAAALVGRIIGPNSKRFFFQLFRIGLLSRIAKSAEISPVLTKM
jgi:hypothetical protein